MNKLENKHWFYLISLLFIAINLVFVAYEVYYIAFLPLILLFVFASFVALDKILMVIVFFTPLSVQLKDFLPGITFNVSIPTEPLLFGVLILFVFKLLIDGKIDKNIVLHPVSMAISFYLFWILITSLTSTIPLVSIKFFLSKLWFIVSMYLLAAHLFKDKKNIERFIWLYIGALMVVIAYTNYRLSGYGFDNQRASNWVVWPFFSDHTSYGAMLVMFIFPIFYFFTRKTSDLFVKAIIGLVFLVFIFAIVFSYTRAAWLSLFAGIGLWIVIKLKIQIRTLILGGAVILIFVFISYSSFVRNLEKNKSESSGRFTEHLESMANITTMHRTRKG